MLGHVWPMLGYLLGHVGPCLGNVGLFVGPWLGNVGLFVGAWGAMFGRGRVICWAIVPTLKKGEAPLQSDTALNSQRSLSMFAIPRF